MLLPHASIAVTIQRAESEGLGMRAGLCVTAMALPLLGGCEVFEPYAVEYETLISRNGVSVTANLMEDFSSRWRQFTASNYSDYPVCAQVSLTGNPSTSGHSMGGIYRIDPGATMDIGYVTMPAHFGVNARTWEAKPDGGCGYGPPD
jgi:hypothetical protein